MLDLSLRHLEFEIIWNLSKPPNSATGFKSSLDTLIAMSAPPKIDAPKAAEATDFKAAETVSPEDMRKMARQVASDALSEAFDALKSKPLNSTWRFKVEITGLDRKSDTPPPFLSATTSSATRLNNENWMKGIPHHRNLKFLPSQGTRTRDICNFCGALKREEFIMLQRRSIIRRIIENEDEFLISFSDHDGYFHADEAGLRDTLRKACEEHRVIAFLYDPTLKNSFINGQRIGR